MIRARRRRYRGQFTREDCYIERVGDNHHEHVQPDGTRNRIDVTDWMRRKYVTLGFWRDVTEETSKGA